HPHASEAIPMAINDQLRSAFERSAARSKQNAQRYYDGIGKVVDTTSRVLGRLPAGERISSAYAERSTKLVESQRQAVLRLLDAQPKVRTRARSQASTVEGAS